MNRILSLLAITVFVSPTRADLKDYIKKDEPAFEWKLAEKNEYPQGVTYHIQLVSQEWEKIKWQHSLVIYQPKGIKPRDVMFLWVTGGKPSLGSAAMALDLSTKMQAPVAFLFDIPNQPIFDKKEDAPRWPISKDGLIGRETQTQLVDAKTIPLTKELFAKDALVLKGLRSSGISLRSARTKRGLRMDFAGFDDYWRRLESLGGPSGLCVAALSDEARATLREHVWRGFLCNRPEGPRSFAATAWARRGTVRPKARAQCCAASRNYP